MVMQKGFTLIELVIAISVMAILLGTTYIQFQSGQEGQELANAGEQMVAHIQQMQSRATANIVECNQGDFGLYIRPNIEPQKYVLFADCDDVGGSQDRYTLISGDEQIYDGETEIHSSQVVIESFHDNSTDRSPHSILFKSLTGAIYIDGVEMTLDRASILLQNTSSSECSRIDIIRASETIQLSDDPDCDPATT